MVAKLPNFFLETKRDERDKRDKSEVANDAHTNDAHTQHYHTTTDDTHPRFRLLGLLGLLGLLLFWDERDKSEDGQHLTARQCKAHGSINADKRTAYYPSYPILPILPIKRTTIFAQSMGKNE